MAAIEEGLWAHLAAQAGITALVGQRVYPNFIPQDAALPAMAYQRMSGGERVFNHSSASGLSRAVFRLTLRGMTYEAAHDLAAAVRASTDNFRGTMGTVAVDIARLGPDDVDGYSQVTGAHWVSLDLEIWFKES